MVDFESKLGVPWTTPKTRQTLTLGLEGAWDRQKIARGSPGGPLEGSKTTLVGRPSAGACQNFKVANRFFTLKKYFEYKHKSGRYISGPAPISYFLPSPVGPKLRASGPKRQDPPRNVNKEAKKRPNKFDLETLSGPKVYSERLG